MEGASKENSRVSPVATTSPHHGLKEELLSQSSSGTQISNASGISLGEVIRHKSIINQEMEAWYQPCTDVGTSNHLTPVEGGRLGQTVACDLTEFSTMEEGLITPTENSQRQQESSTTHTALLEIQDSCLSPNLPLMTTCSTQGQTFFSETIFPQTEVDFAPLRGTPDVSDTTSEDTSRHFHMSEAVWLATTDIGSDSSADSNVLSQPLLASRTMAPSNASLASCLSQYPLSFSGPIALEQRLCGEEHHTDGTSKSKDRNFGVLGSQKLPNQQLPVACPSKEPWRSVLGQDLFLLDSNVPAPLLLEMLEEEVGLSKDCGFLSSESSSCQSNVAKDPEENEASQLMESVILVEREPETFVEPNQQEERTISHPNVFTLLSKAEAKSFRNNGDMEQLSANALQAPVSFRNLRGGLGDSCSITGSSGRPIINKQEIWGAPFEEQKRVSVAGLANCRLDAPDIEEAHTGVTKKELTLSDFSIEREHKDNGVSPSFNEVSFFGQLAHPIHHSTPGVFIARKPKKEAPGLVPPVKSLLQSPLSCVHEEPLKTSSARTHIPSVEEPRGPSGDDTYGPSAEEPLTLQSRQHANTRSSDSLGLLYPLKGKIQSMPSLNFMEKVGAWNMSQSAERMSDALALHTSSGISPRQKAYSVTADSLTTILLKQKNQADLKAGLTASLCGPLSMASPHSYHKQLPRTLPLTRSHSENSVLSVSREVSKADVGHEHQPSEGKGNVSGGSGFKQDDSSTEDSLIPRYTAVLVSAVSSDEETIASAGRGKGSNPDNFITSDRVAELLREEASSHSGTQEMSDGTQNNGRELSTLHLHTDQTKMDSFRDVSPDSLNQLTGSGTGSYKDLRLPSRQSSRRSSALSGKLHSSLEDVSQTPDHREINIEERIPVYLHNLGIDQLPSSILTPFMPRGPVREIELSPTELRTLKASTDLFAPCLQLSEGDSHSVINAMQSSSDPSTYSGPLPEESAVHPPAEPSLQTSTEMALEFSQACHPLQAPASGSYLEGSSSAQQSLGVTAVFSDSHSDEKLTKSVQMQVNKGVSNEAGRNQDKLTFSSISEGKDGKTLDGKENSLTTVVEREKDDSFIGSKTMKAIWKLVGEAEARIPGRNIKSSSSISHTMGMDRSSKQSGEMDGYQESSFIKGNTPGFQRIASWDESVARQDFQEDHWLRRSLSLSGSLKQEGKSLPVDFGSSEPIAAEKLRSTFQAAGERNQVLGPVKRSEPEGCTSVTVNKNLPFFVNRDPNSSSEDVKECQASSHTLGNIYQVLEKTKEADSKQMGSSHTSGNSSSMDSLGIKVRNLLQSERPLMQPTPWVSELECDGCGQKPGSSGSSLAFSRNQDVGVHQSDNSSSLDSLAARVRSLLADERPVMHATQILQSAEEEEKKAHASVKLKLAIHAPGSVPDLSEEDLLLIEEIKKQHHLGAKKVGFHTQNQVWGDGSQRISNHSLNTRNGLSKIQGQNDLQKAIYTHNFQVVEFPDVNAVQVGTVCGTNSTFPVGPEIKSLPLVQSQACKQLQTPSDKELHSGYNFHIPLCSTTDVQLMEGQTCASRAVLGEARSVLAQAEWTVTSSSSEPAKQITSITFASRKRSLSPCAPCPGLTEVTPCNFETSKTQPVSSDEPKSIRWEPETFKSHPSVNPTAIHVPDVNPGFSSVSCYRQNGTKVGLHQENGKPQASCVKPENRCVMEAHEEIKACSQMAPDLGRLEKSFGVACDNPSNRESMVTGLQFSVNLPLQKANGVCLQGRSGNSTGSFISEPFFLSDKEDTTKESKLTFDSQPHSTGDTGTINPLPPASPDCSSAAVPVPSASPSRKALSAIHITLSSKHIGLDCSSPLNTGPETRKSYGFKMKPLPVILNDPPPSCEATSMSKPVELLSKTQEASHLPRLLSSPVSHLRHSPVSYVPKQISHESEKHRQNLLNTDERNARVLHSSGSSLEESAKITAASQTERMSSDAITQITMESPEKTTYSAEIFVSTDSNEADTARPLHQKKDQFPSTTSPAVSQISVLDRQAGMPVLLPYKPPGSSEMYYVPCPKEVLRLSNVRSETTMESTHSGSNDAVPPEFPAQLLGSRDDNPPSTVAIKHKEGIYSKRIAPRNAWTEEKVSAQKGVEESIKIRHYMEPVKATSSFFRSGQFYLHHPMPLQHEIDLHSTSWSLSHKVSQEHLANAPEDILKKNGMVDRSQAPFSQNQVKRDDKFSPLNPELDYSFMDEISLNKSSERGSPRKEGCLRDMGETDHEVAKEHLHPDSTKSNLKEKKGADHPLMQDAHLTSSLDELWTKYLECQKYRLQPNSSSNRKELSLVERLDRLSRLLNNPVSYSLLAKEKQSCIQERKEPEIISSQGKMVSISKLTSHCKVEESPDVTGAGLSKPRPQNIGVATTVGHLDRNSEQLQNYESQSNTSSEMRPVKDSSVLTDITSESEATQLETESASQMEASDSVSTIDTARLLRAFGHDRVQVSPKLSQLYSTINLQKTCLEKRIKGSRRARGADYPKMAHSVQKRKDSQTANSFISSDSISTSSASQGPSSALNTKRSRRMLNKAIQAGDFEIVNSATKRHTRDVGLTFPTPMSSQARLQGDHRSGTEEEAYQLDGHISEGTGKQKQQSSGFRAERRQRRNKPWELQGVSWFVPAEDLKSEPQRKNGGSPPPLPSPSWFEPLLGTTPWREPLREKNWQEGNGSLQVHPMVPKIDGENKPPSPFVKITLQEALSLRRPDFISSSGERVKRLKLIIEERKLQCLLQGEREELFNRPEERRNYRNGSCSLLSREYRTVQQKRAISKNEMFQRSKRIYEQLPEVRKRREEEKRKSAYSTNRLKAQLYKTKITNHILGRKVPWE